MARRCVICNKGTETGHKVSHSNRKTNRTWGANVQRIRIILDGKRGREYVCTRCIKGGKVVRAL